MYDMAATRPYAIASYDKTHLARTRYARPILATIVAVALAVPWFRRRWLVVALFFIALAPARERILT